MICDDSKGNHWVKLSYGNGVYHDLGMVVKGWCGHPTAITSWADVIGDGKADMICDDHQGRHWI